MRRCLRENSPALAYNGFGGGHTGAPDSAVQRLAWCAANADGYRIGDDPSAAVRIIDTAPEVNAKRAVRYLHEADWALVPVKTRPPESRTNENDPGPPAPVHVLLRVEPEIVPLMPPPPFQS